MRQNGVVSGDKALAKPTRRGSFEAVRCVGLSFVSSVTPISTPCFIQQAANRIISFYNLNQMFIYVFTKYSF